ncbi:MAG TPA: hypothetical protein PKV60_06495, partial [Thermomonas sp.]|nr:hypothetical protein [Thermomonas sp.]
VVDVDVQAERREHQAGEADGKEQDQRHEVFAKPGWAGVEATHAPRYYNLALASRPYSQWREDEQRACDLNQGH